MKSSENRVFSGVQPSGEQVHWGNYFGAMKRFVELADGHETLVCLVDLHALTTVFDADQLRRNSQSLVAAYLAIGLDPENVTVFRQSDVPEVCELTWYLACQFPFGLLERATTLKDARAKNLTPNAGVAFYPILMAADILLYKATKIPVGADQKQHLEMTREIVSKFNRTYGEVFPIPEPLISESSGVVVGSDGEKMSKSKNNYIGMFEPSKKLRKKIMGIVTDSKLVEDSKDPDTCSVFTLYKLFASNDEQDELANRYRAGGMGYGEAKQCLFEAAEKKLAPMREVYESWMERPDDLHDLLSKGAQKARSIADATITEVREAVGVLA